MKFLNDLYTVTAASQDADAHRVTVRFNPSHPVYKAHFPGNPITPGVLLMQMARLMLEDILDKGLRLQEVANIKFNKPVCPDDTATFTFARLTEQDNRLKASIRIEVEGTAYAKMSLVYNIVPRTQTDREPDAMEKK